jgi:hypothetical protein
VYELQYTFLRDWYYMTDENPDRLLAQEHFPPSPCDGPTAIRVINSGPSSDADVLCDAY